jgi:sulfonate transport system substrate-binding protein
MRRTTTTGGVTLVTLSSLAALAVSGCNAVGEDTGYDETAAISQTVDKDTVLRIGDPRTEALLEASGLIDELDFTPEWANIDGGPKTLEAFRADALDVGAVADIPPLFATWTNTPVRVVAARRTVDPLEHPTYELGVAPGADVRDISDLKGKRIAYSPGQAQGALVLRVLEEAGLSQDDVDLVELQSTDDTFVNVIAKGEVDVAPLGISQARSYLAKYGQDGASTVAPGVPDDPWHLYVPTKTLQDEKKTAALRQYVQVWNKLTPWINDHREQFADLYLVDRQGLSEEDARYVVDRQGDFTVPENWDGLISEHQETADLLSREQDHPEIDVEDIYDRRFEPEELAA